MFDLVIYPKYEIRKAPELGCNYILSIQDAVEVTDPVSTPHGIPHFNHRHFFFDDLDFEVSPEGEGRPSHRDGTVFRYTTPKKTDVEAMLKFGQEIPEDSKLFVHCFAGVSRSTATAFMLNCWGHPDMDEFHVLRLTAGQATSRYIHPNSLIVQYADELLDRKGRMLQALDRFQHIHTGGWTSPEE